MAMLIFALASFSFATERRSIRRSTLFRRSILFRLPESCRDKKSLLALCGPKSKLQEGKSGGASEASNQICCYQAGKRMNSKIAFTECEDLKNSWSFPIKCREKKCPQCLLMFTNCSVNVTLMNCNVNVNG